MKLQYSDARRHTSEKWATAHREAMARMAVAPTYPGDRTDERGQIVHEHTDRQPTAKARVTVTGEVWCRHCDRPAECEVRLTTGEWASYCTDHITRLTIQKPLKFDEEIGS